jgi:c-di-GMP-binding flagellar brake protein YcgR
MLQLSDIRTGSNLILQLESQMELDPSFELKSKFEDDLGNEIFSIAAPMWKGQYYRIQPDDTVRVFFFFDGARQVFEATPLTRYERDKLSFLRLRKISEIVEIQLREDFRLPVDDDACIILDEDKQEDDEHTRRVRLKDLSGGGVGFLTNWDPGRLTALRMQLSLNSSTEELNAEVRRIEERDNDPRYRYSIGAKFVFDSEQEKERIVRHIFKLQKKKIQEQKKKIQ